MKQPNFLIISSDQQRGDCLGVEGRRIKTPNLDRLCEQGTRFKNAICPSVVCQPARASILTGQLCRTHGAHDNGIDLDPKTGERGFAGRLSEEGYQTAFFGKAHFSTYHAREKTGSPESVLSSEDFGDDWSGPYMGFEHVELMLVGHNWFPPEKPPRGHHYERFYHGDGGSDRKQELYWENAGDTKGAAQCWHSRLPLEWHNTPWTSNRTLEWLKARDPEKPFCAWTSFPDPHHPFDCPEPWSRLHDPAEVDIPKHRERDFDRRPWWHRAAIENEPQGEKSSVEMRKLYSRIPPQSEDQLREIIANTYGQIAMIDHEVGRIMDALDELGIADNTYVIYLSDHGDWLGDHGLILKGPMFYEGLLRVPLIVRGPNTARGAVVDEPVNTMDIAPTLFDITGTKPGLPPHGKSLRPLMEGKPEKRGFAMSEWELLAERAGVALSLRCVRTKTHKLTLDMRSGAGELYDLVNDPDEMHDRFNDPACAEVQAELMDYVNQRPDDIGPNRVPVGPA